MKNFPVYFLFVLLLLPVGCAPTSVSKLEQTKGARTLPPDKVLPLADSNTLFIHSLEEDTYLFFDHSGRLFGKDIYGNQDTGRWDVSEQGELCMRMRNWWYGDLRCFQVLHADTTYYLGNTSGVLQYTAKLMKGDAKSLYRETRKKRRSYRRRSIRGKQPPQQTVPTTEPAGSAQPQPEAGQAIVEENSYRTPSAEKDLRSTVKWMAHDCPGCNLAHTDLKKANLVGADLAGADLQGANLRMANLRRANLEGANLEDAVLRYTNLPGANLRGANLRGADIKGANLIRADLTGARLDGADLEGALLDGVKGLKK